MERLIAEAKVFERNSNFEISGLAVSEEISGQNRAVKMYKTAAFGV